MRLAVNIDHIATIRQARRAREPEPVAAALLAELAGAEGITVHLRGDRRHIQDRDLELLRQVIATKLNVEMAATEEMVTIASRIRPDQVTLVPERPQEVTTEGGLNLLTAGDLSKVIGRFRDAGIRLSIFLDPDVAQVKAAHEVGADAIEINTGPYADDPRGRHGHLDRIREAADVAAASGLEVLAGHGLTYVNIRPIAALPRIVELNIGHSIVSRAALVGMERAVREMMALLREGAASVRE
jgi:pyridoxine 5-phosphate synthase